MSPSTRTSQLSKACTTKSKSPTPVAQKNRPTADQSSPAQPTPKMPDIQDTEMSSEPAQGDSQPVSNSTPTQDESTDINMIISKINNPSLLQDSATVADMTQSNSPSNSPAK